MKSFFMSIFVFMSLASLAFADDTDPVLPGFVGKEKIAGFSVLPVEEVFVPGGFDDNDITEVVVKGTLPNSCWKMGQPNTKYDESTKTYKIFVTSFVLKNQICLPVTSTFVESVKLGTLKSGQYSVETKSASDDLITKALNIKEANSGSSDNYLYAQVESIHMLKPNDQEVDYEIQGRIPPMEGKCLVLSETRAGFDSENVLTVLPILKEGTSGDCTPEELRNGRDFSVKLKEENSSHKDFLIHARSINGQSVNRFVSGQ